MGLNNNERIELHCHTCGSRMNGTAGSTDIFRYARQEGIKAIAFTDYDTISTYPEIQTLVLFSTLNDASFFTLNGAISA